MSARTYGKGGKLGGGLYFVMYSCVYTLHFRQQSVLILKNVYKLMVVVVVCKVVRFQGHFGDHWRRAR
jgi:hypothetical protein